MDSFQDQIASLHARIDALQQMIERLGDRISDVLTEIRTPPGSGSHRLQSHAGHRYSTPSHRSELETVMEHKDVLMDTNIIDTDSQGGERALSSEVQIQRLTAQLTAAYNRMAALEEQLLSRRLH
jgi:hypothetical protein